MALTLREIIERLDKDAMKEYALDRIERFGSNENEMSRQQTLITDTVLPYFEGLTDSQKQIVRDFLDEVSNDVWSELDIEEVFPWWNQGTN